VIRNIVSGGPSIIRKPGAYRSNLELTNSLRSNFLAAKQDYAQFAPATNGTRHEHVENSDKALLEAWIAREASTIYIPRIDWSTAGLQEEASQYDITVKIFYLPKASVEERAQYTTEALELVRKELGIHTIDLLIASFPGMSFDGDCEWEADKKNAAQGNIDEEAATWVVLEGLHKQGLVKRLGIAEFGSEKLAKFMKKTAIRPSVDQINIKDCCSVPPPLIKLAKEEGVELLVHSDCTDILPSGTLRELLGHGLQGAGTLSDAENEAGLKGDLTPQWVVKYTAFVRDRGVIENKGYFAGAELLENC
jgi:glutamate--cysteine ligase regulatory subunit